MSLISNIIVIASGSVELASLILYANFLGILPVNKINKIKIIPTLITYIGISMLILVLKSFSGQITSVFAMILYYFKFFLAIYILYKHLSRKIIFFTFLADMSISIVGSCASCILANLISTNSSDVSPSVKMFVQLTVLFVILFLGKNADTERNVCALAMIPRHVFIMLILAILSLSALSSLISYTTDNQIKKENTLISIVAILTIILICIVASLFLNVIAKQHFTVVSQMMQKQVDLQISHYKELEKMNYEISRFRHDYNNHLLSILSLIRRNEHSQAEEYILNLRKINYKSELHIFYTGNGLADALLSAKASALDNGCSIKYSGIIPESIDNVDLCVILSNALDNAIEACKDLQDPGIISIYATDQQGYFVLSIKNPTVCSDNYYDIPSTTKPDKEKHGMGLYNIENMVKKNDGQMKIKCENGFFELMITMKIRTEPSINFV